VSGELEVTSRCQVCGAPHNWHRDRYLELAPRYWRITRARLDRQELDREVGWLTLPGLPLPTMLPSDALATPLTSAP
jgi:hypothetical protein